ncbi:MAG: GWxTD domain-containing protein [Deferribacteres bacterium]|nr:GWxTD domain-containing protein [Deferribacteres bacterium]
MVIRFFNTWTMLICTLFCLAQPVLFVSAKEKSFEEIEKKPAYQTGLEDYQLALAAIDKKEYDLAEEYLHRVLAENALFQEKSGKSAWQQLGRVLELQDKKMAAVEVLEKGIDTLKSAGLSDYYLNFDLARMYAENRIEGREALITSLVYEVLQHITYQNQPDLLQRFVDVVSFNLNESERDQIKKARNKKPGEPVQTLYNFLRREDPNPVTEQNELISIIFQREAEARERFTTYSSLKGYDERGDIFVRLGNPWKIYPSHSGTPGEMGYAIYPYEIWLYTQRHPDLYFTFIRERGVGDYKLVDGAESLLGSFYKRRREFFNRGNPGQTVTSLRFHLYEELAGLHEDFKERVYRLQEQYSAAEAADYANAHFIAEDRAHAAYVDTLMQTFGFGVVDVSEILPLELSGSWFSDLNGDLRTEFYYSLRNRDLFYDKYGENLYTILLGEAAIFDENFKLVVHDSLRHKVNVGNGEESQNGVFLSQWNVLLKPGKYNLFFKLENPNSKKQSTIRTEFELLSPPATGLYLSDIQLALDIHPSDENGLFTKNGYFIKPKTNRKIQNEQNFFVYFETYRLSLDANGKSNYQAEYIVEKEQEKKRLFGLLGSTPVTKRFYRDQVQKNGQNPIQAESHNLALGDLEKGEYSLKIVVTDLNSGEKASNAIRVQVIK